MEHHEAETTELFYGLRPDPRKGRSISRPTSTISRSKEKAKTINAPDLDAKTDRSPYLESMKSEVMSKIATLEASLLAEIHESRAREQRLRNRLAKSRVVTKDLQAKLTKYDQAEGGVGLGHGHVSDEAEQVRKAAPAPSRACWNPPAISSCGDLRQLARNQVIRSVQDISPQFAVDLEVHSCGGYIPWPSVLNWLQEHPEVVDFIGLNLHALRTI